MEAVRTVRSEQQESVWTMADGGDTMAGRIRGIFFVFLFCFVLVLFFEVT